MESLTLLVEHPDHRMEVMDYADWCKRVGRQAKHDPLEFEQGAHLPRGVIDELTDREPAESLAS